MCHQTEREQNEFIQVAQPLVETETPGCAETEERFRPDDGNVNSIREQAFLKQVSQPQHAVLVV
jgi:hypothetical protein